MSLGHIISIDAECNGLGGEAFAVAMTLSGQYGELDHKVYRCPIDATAEIWYRYELAIAPAINGGAS